MFFVILTSGYTVMLAYVVWRTSSVPLISRRMSRMSIFGIGIGLWVVFVLGWALGHRGTGHVAAAIESIGMILLGSIFLVSISLFAVDCVTVFGLVFSRRAPTLRGLAMAAGIMLSAVALVQGLRAPAVVSYEVILPSLPAGLDGTVLVAVSDTHFDSKMGEQWFAERIAEIAALRPDIVVFLGDIFEGHGDAPRDIQALRRLSAPLGKWFVQGNHESYQDDDAANDILEKAGFRGLADQWAEPAPGLVLAGVNYLGHHRHQEPGEDPFGRALAGRPAGATILLSHEPRQADRAAQAGVELMLSGHTHGGQIWPFGYLIKAFYPLVAGRYEVDGMTVIVCWGTGTWGPPMRLWHRAEILKITLRSG